MSSVNDKVRESEDQLFNIGDKVKLLVSPCDLQKSVGEVGVISHIHPTARADGSVWFNYSVDLRPGYGVCCFGTQLEKVNV